MPNGHFPTVPGLQVVHLNRTEQRYPRFDWAHSSTSFWATRLVGGQGYPPTGSLEVDATARFEELTHAVAEVVRAHWSPKDAQGSAVAVDFEACAGQACGSFFAYGGSRGYLELLHDPSVAGSRGLAGAGLDAALTLVTTSLVSQNGIERHSGDDGRFSFEGRDELLVTSFALHLEGGQPLRSSRESVLVALERDDGRDQLLALWRRPERG
jgi:hypothetical protein